PRVIEHGHLLVGQILKTCRNAQVGDRFHAAVYFYCIPWVDGTYPALRHSLAIRISSRSVNVVDPRFRSRRDEMLDQAVVTPDLLKDLLPRLETFVAPFAATLVEAEPKRHAAEYISGLLSNLEHKTGEGIAYLHDQRRQGLQKFIGHVPWDHRSLLRTLAEQVGHELGEPDGVIVFDPSSFPKKGTRSVGVAKQWCGR